MVFLKIKKAGVRACTKNIETFGLIDISAEKMTENGSDTLYAKDICLTGDFGILCRTGGVCEMQLALRNTGTYGICNALAAILVTSQFGVKNEIICRTLSDITVEGRMEEVFFSKEIRVFVDYSQNAGSLRSVFFMLKSHPHNRIICVFGCSGERSVKRWTGMGEVCGEFADLTVITSDNNLSEDSVKIMLDIKKAVTGSYAVIPDRREAIRFALKKAKPGDIVLITGRSHEKYIVSGGKRICFSDKAEIENYRKERERTSHVPDMENAENGICAKAFGLIDLTSMDVIRGKAFNQKIYPASVTKILTCLIVLEKCHLDETLSVSPESEMFDLEDEDSSGFLRAGDRLTVEDALFLMMVLSGNDAAIVLAEHVAGSVGVFVTMMNRKAKMLGSSDSNFTNPCGLPDNNHYSTVRDMSLIFQECLKNRMFREITSSPHHTMQVKCANGKEKEYCFTSTNGLCNGLADMPDFYTLISGKTGHTMISGYSLIMAFSDAKGKEYTAMISGAPGYYELYEGMKNLISVSGKDDLNMGDFQINE